MTMLVRLEQSLNAVCSIVVTLSGISTLFKLVQSAKALDVIETTPFGIETTDRLEQRRNAISPIEVTLVGNVTSVSLLQSEKAPDEIDVTPFGIV